jgi:arsenite methyltransferase
VKNQIHQPQYGIDAPDLVRFFFIAGAIALIVFIGVMFSSIFGQIPMVVIGTLLGIATSYLLGMGCLMIYYSKVTKLKDNEDLLNLCQWSGDELVLDAGCGRGLGLVGAAKRLTSGKAIGIDIWQQQDQANNSSAAALSNAAIEGVEERVEVQTADMCQIPFPDDYFDVVTSSWAIHNIEAEIDRKKALDEIIRVLKPNGTILIADIINQVEYAEHFELRGMKNVRLHNHPIRDSILSAVSFGSFAPSIISVSNVV